MAFPVHASRSARLGCAVATPARRHDRSRGAIAGCWCRRTATASTTCWTARMATFLLGVPFVKKLTWASGIGADGRPQLLPNNAVSEQGTLTCPAIRGATNWMATSFHPGTRLFYVMAVENCGVYRSSMFGRGRRRGRRCARSAEVNSEGRTRNSTSGCEITSESSYGTHGAPNVSRQPWCGGRRAGDSRTVTSDPDYRRAHSSLRSDTSAGRALQRAQDREPACTRSASSISRARRPARRRGGDQSRSEPVDRGQPLGARCRRARHHHRRGHRQSGAREAGVSRSTWSVTTRTLSSGGSGAGTCGAGISRRKSSHRRSSTG